MIMMTIKEMLFAELSKMGYDEKSVLKEIDSSSWDQKNPNYGDYWQWYVPDSIRRIWDCISIESKLCAFVIAKSRADAFDFRGEDA
jgi:hypothetical protein